MVERVLAGPAGGRSEVCGSFCASWIAAAVAGSAALPLVLWRRTWPVGLDRIALHADAGGWFDRISIGGRLRVLPDDVAATRPGVDVGADLPALRGRWAAETAAALGPLFRELARRLRFGLPGMWGSVADGVAGHTLWVGNAVGAGPDRVWAEVTALLDALAEAVPQIRVRPRRHLVPWSGGVGHTSVRGTCCLHYRTVETPDPDGDGYCSSCPLRTDASRERRIAAHLDGRADGAD